MCLFPIVTYAQFGVNYHQSNLPFIGFNYEIANRFRPELRIGVDEFIIDNSYEGVLTYDIMNKSDYEFYAGVGLRTKIFTAAAMVLPIGLNFFPFNSKKFGFHIEYTPISRIEFIRGSWGIRYRFGEK